MQTIEPTEHLRRKLALLDERSVRRWPKWENDDYIAVKFLLGEVAVALVALEGCNELNAELIKDRDEALQRIEELEQQVRGAWATVTELRERNGRLVAVLHTDEAEIQRLRTLMGWQPEDGRKSWPGSLEANSS